MIDIQIDREADQPLYAQIRDALSAAMDEGLLSPGEQLPTVAAFAAEAGVTQGTVRRAYEDLIKSGRVVSQVGRGTFVLDPAEAGPGSSPAPSPSSPPPGGDPELRQAAQRLRMGIAQSLENLFSLQDRPGLISFSSGVPAADSIRPGLLEEMARRALIETPAVRQSRLDPAGLPALREALVEYFHPWGLDLTPDHILVTNGTQQAIALLAKATEPGRRIICETPCYTGVPGAFETFGHFVETAPRDEDGPDIGRLGRLTDGRPTLFYLCPELHNPMGTDLSPDRLRRLAAWGRENRTTFIADHIFHDIRFEGDPPPLPAVEEGLDSWVMVGSFSKSFQGGLRVGWLVSDPERVRLLAGLKKAMDLGSPPLTQAMVLSLITSEAFEEHLSSVRRRYRVGRDALVKALSMYMPEGVTWTVPKGGFNMWVRLPEGYSSIALYFMAVERGVSFIPGPYMDRDHRFVNAFRLGYSQNGPDAIREGVELLGASVKELLRGPTSDMGLSGLGVFL